MTLPQPTSRQQTWLGYLLIALLAWGACLVGANSNPQHLPSIHDEYAYLFAGRTYAEGRLTNPTPPLWRFFEAHHILMTPSYMAKYPPGQGLLLAVGYWLGHPIRGVWLGSVILSLALTWMLRAFLPRRWAIAGGALSVLLFGFNYYWAQSYWGGSLAAAGGALLLGGSWRVLHAPRVGGSLALGVGVMLLAYTRPFEGLLTCLVPAIFLAKAFFRFSSAERMKAYLPATGVVVFGMLFLAYDNRAVTGAAWRFPYMDYEQQYLRLPIFAWQTTPPPPEFKNAAMANLRANAVARDFSTQLVIVRFRHLLQQLIGPVFVLFILAAALWRSRGGRFFLWLTLFMGLLPLLISNLYFPHYEAPIVGLLLLGIVSGFRFIVLRLPRFFRRPMAGWSLLVAAHVSIAWPAWAAAWKFEQRDLRNVHQRTEDALSTKPKKQLVIVRLVKPYRIEETLVSNEPRMDQAQVVWAWDRGAENEELLAQFPDREARIMSVGMDTISFLPVVAKATAR